MKKNLLFCILWLACLLFSTEVFGQSEKNVAATTPAAPTVTKRIDGFLPLLWDAKKGTLSFELSPERMNGEFIYFTGLSSGVGSIQMFADRSSVGQSQLCRFLRVGDKVLVVAENTTFRAERGSAELKHSVERSFPTSILAALPVQSEQNGEVMVNANPLLLRDAFGLQEQLRRPSRATNGVVRQSEGGGASWRMDDSRSAIDIENTRGFPLNTEVENILTFTSDTGRGTNAPENGVMTVHEHVSLLALPEAGYQTRESDPRVGFFGEGFKDFSTKFNEPLDRSFIARWRLVKKDPNAAMSEPVKPIVFYLDSAIPEPIRSAAREGALWWNRAFEQAGFRNALKVEDLPEGADPLDVRYPAIQWTNRDGRGWSVGMAQTDPRTGEILHAVVQLDSHRMRTVHNYWQVVNHTVGAGRDDSAMDLFAELDSADPTLTEEQVMLKRIALLTCHEMGHVLGLEHNFAGSTFHRGSVMDYFAPRIGVRKDGTADLSDAYMQGTGSYDRFAIEWGYSQGAAGENAQQEHGRLERIVQRNLKQGIFWANYDDPRWNSYDDGPDPVSWLREVLPVRNALVANYAAKMLKPGEPVSKLASRFPLVYLFHRYALAAALNTVGSAKIPPALVGDGQKPMDVWPVESQRQALQLAMQALRPEYLEVPPAVWQNMVQYENHGQNPEAYRSSAGYLFNPQDGARSVAEIVYGSLIDPTRLARMDSIRHFVPAAPSSREVVDLLVESAFVALKSGSQRSIELSSAVQDELADQLMMLAADEGATPEIRDQGWHGVEAIYARVKTGSVRYGLARRIEAFMRDPRQNVPKQKGSGAPAGPPI